MDKRIAKSRPAKPFQKMIEKYKPYALAEAEKEKKRDRKWTYRHWRPDPPVIPISVMEQEQIDALSEYLLDLPLYSELETDDAILEQPLPIPDGQIAYLENDKEPVLCVTDKPSVDTKNGAYTGRNWRLRVTDYDGFICRFEKGFAVSSAICDRYGRYIRRGELWYGSSRLLGDGDEWADGTPEKAKYPDPCYSLDELLERYPLLREYARAIIPSARSLHKGRPFKCRIDFDFGQVITDARVFKAIGSLLSQEFPFLPPGVTHNPIVVAFGAAHQYKDAWINPEGRIPQTLIDVAKSQGLAEIEDAKKRKKEKQQRNQHRAERRTREEAVTTELKKRGYFFETPKDPIVEYLNEPAERLLLDLGCSPLSGDAWHWYESGAGRSFELTDGVIKPFSASIAHASPNPDPNAPVNAHRLIAYHLYGKDLTKDADKRELRCLLANDGYGTHPDNYDAYQREKSTVAESEGLPSLRRNASLTITGDAKETLATLRDNDNALTEAFANALTETDADTPHYHILHFEMGSGKNHSLLTSLATLKKRGIGIFENHEQVDEQALKASLMGLSSAKLRGRGYKFDDSNLRLTDIVSRRLNDALFDENPNVMCAFYDVIENREEKGLAPYPYCLNCPFYENQSCPYINQFIGVSEKDFIAACMHDLFFDPNFRHILAGLWRTSEDSEEESVIGDALGLAPKEASSFDIGILDEVIARNLYLDYTYSFQDMHELAEAWQGEPLADFMKQLLDCLNDKTDAPLETVQTHIESLSENVQMLIASQMTQIPEDVNVHEHTLRDRDTENVLSEAYIEEPSGIQRRVPVSQEAEAILREKKVPVRPYRKIAPKTKIGVSPYRGNGVSPDEVDGRLWAGGWTLLDQLQKAIRIDIEWIGTKYNAKGEQVCCDTFTITVPPQVSDIAKLLILMGGTMDVENIITAFERQDVNFTASNGTPARYARGVKTYQLTDRRLTYRSVFEVETDAEGKTVFDDDTQKPIVIGLTAPAETELEKLCMLAEKHVAEGHLKPVFISYKDFTETPISETPIVKRMHQCLQVKHFDLTRGLNFDGVKVFIVYGLPKSAKPDLVKQTAEILYHTELAQTPLDMTYQRGNEVREGYKAENIGVYADKRMEAVRQQLTRDKSKQALYRARPTRWQDTITLHFSAEPIPDWTERATGFVRTDLQTAERFEDIGGVIKARENAEQNGDVKALASATGQSERTTYRKTDTTRKHSKVDMQARAYQLYSDNCDNDTIIAILQSEYGKKVTDRTLRRWRKKDKF